MSEAGENKKIKNELDRNSRIKKEFKRINVFFKNLKENEKSITSPLIQNAAFMRVTLDDLQQIIAEQGPVEAYQNGANQYGMKQSAALQSYNALVKNYAAVIKTLSSLLPPMSKPKQEQIETLLTGNEEEDELSEEEKARQLREEINRAAEYQRRMRELEDLIKKADSQEERNRLVEEKKALRYH